MYDHVKSIFWIFSIVLLWSFAYSGKKLSQTQHDKSYWKYAALPILVFTSFYGLRFGRLIDYNLYEVRYQALGNHLDDEYELLFQYLCHWGASFGIHYQYLIILISFLVILSAFCLFKDTLYRKAMLYILGVFLFVVVPIEQLVRWYLAAAFYVFAIYFFLKSNYIKSSIFAACSCLIHIGFIPLVAFFIIIYSIHVQLIPEKICMLLLLFSIFFGNTQMLEGLSPYLSILSMDDKSSKYVDNFSTLVTEGSRFIGIREFGFTTQIRMFLAYSFPLLFSKSLKNIGVKTWVINTYCIAIIANPIFSKIEILDRYCAILLLISVPITTGMTFYMFIKNYSQYKMQIRWWGILSIIANIYPTFSYLFGRKEWWYMLFIWDANGRETLPLYYFN